MKFKDWCVCIGAGLAVLAVIGIGSIAFLGLTDNHPECMFVHCVKILP